MARSAHSTQYGRIEVCRQASECAGRAAPVAGVDRRQHVNSYQAPVYHSRISCPGSYFYVIRTWLPAACRGERCQKNNCSHTQKQRVFGEGPDAVLHLFSSLSCDIPETLLLEWVRELFVVSNIYTLF